MSSTPTPSGPNKDDGPTPVQRGLEHARRAMRSGVKLGREHGPVVARKTAAGLKHAGAVIRDSEHTKRIAKTGKKAGKAAGRAVKALDEQVKRYPGIENAWKQTRHAFSMGPESAVDKAAGTTARTSGTLTTKTTRPETATKKKTAARKTTKKKVTAKKKSNRAA